MKRDPGNAAPSEFDFNAKTASGGRSAPNKTPDVNHFLALIQCLRPASTGPASRPIHIQRVLKTNDRRRFPLISDPWRLQSYAPYEALKLEAYVGAMLPCNVVVQDVGGGRTEVSAVDPVASAQAIDNLELKMKAGEVSEKRLAAISRL